MAGAEPDEGGVDGDGLGRAASDGVADGRGSDGNGGGLAVGRGRLGRGRLGRGTLGRGTLGRGRLGRGRLGRGGLGGGGGKVSRASVRVAAGKLARLEPFNGRAPETGATTTTVRIDPHNQAATASLEGANEERVRRGSLRSIDGSDMADIQPSGL